MRVVISIAVFLIIAGGVAFFSVPAIKEARRSRMIEAEIENLRSEAEKINSENNFLREKIEYLKSDHFKESVAKDRLNLRNKGEKVVVVQPNAEKKEDTKKTLGEETTMENFSTEEEKPNYKKWWEMIMK
ncbi:MAG: septum formation initiator family protein [Candidatus Moraniibacteriota bacterium]